MTAICGGGTSQVKPGIADSVIVDAGAITVGLGLIDPLLDIFAVFIDAFVYDALTQCATDPPAMPIFSSTDWTNCIGGMLNPNCSSTLSKVKDAILNYLWYQWCECSVGSPTPYAPPTVPTNISAPQLPSASTCFSGVWSGTIPNSGPAPPGNIGPAIYPHTVGTIPTTISQGLLFNSPPPTAFIASTTITSADAIATGITLTFSCYNSAGTFLGSVTHVFTANPGTTTSFSNVGPFTLPANTAWVIADFYNGTVEVGPFTGSLTLDWVCAGTTPGVLSSCCPTAPDNTAALHTLVQMVTLIQRQIAPFAYVTGTTHSALSGAGQISVQGLLGAKVTPSSIPADAGLVVGDPDELWLDSWITWGNADGWTKREFLTHSPYISMPSLAGQFTEIGYTIRPGMSVDITELVREP